MSEDPTGAEIAEDAPEALGGKAEQSRPRMAALAVAAGMLIGFCGIAFLIVQATPAMTGPVQFLSGLVLSAGMMVMVTRPGLFTGNVMFALPFATRRLLPRRLAGAWTLVWLGNLAGGMAVAPGLGLAHASDEAS